MTKKCSQECALGVAVVGGVLFFLAKTWVAHNSANNPVADANIGAGILGLFGLVLIASGLVTFGFVTALRR